MDRDYLILGSIIGVLFIIQLFISYAVGVNVFPIFQPDFCYDSLAPGLCLNLWGFIELSGICIIFYFIIGHKTDEKIRS